MFKTTWCGGDTAPPNSHNATINVTALGRKASLPATVENKLVGSLCVICVRRARMPALPVLVKQKCLLRVGIRR